MWGSFSSSFSSAALPPLITHHSHTTLLTPHTYFTSFDPTSQHTACQNLSSYTYSPHNNILNTTFHHHPTRFTLFISRRSSHHPSHTNNFTPFTSQQFLVISNQPSPTPPMSHHSPQTFHLALHISHHSFNTVHSTHFHTIFFIAFISHKLFHTNP